MGEWWRDVICPPWSDRFDDLDSDESWYVWPNLLCPGGTYTKSMWDKKLLLFFSLSFFLFPFLIFLFLGLLVVSWRFSTTDPTSSDLEDVFILSSYFFILFFQNYQLPHRGFQLVGLPKVPHRRFSLELSFFFLSIFYFWFSIFLLVSD